MSTRKQVILHVGLPKTGTTYLQRCFADNEDWLLAHGVSYPKVGREHLWGHHNLGRYLNGKPVYDADYGGLDAAELVQSMLDGDASRVLISSESLSALRPEATEQLCDALAGCDVSAVVYLRRRSSVCVSTWSEMVKHGLLLSFEEFLVAELLGPSSRVLRPEVVLSGVHAMTGGESMQVMIYDHLVEDGVEMCEHFLESVLNISIDDSVQRPARGVNQSGDWAKLEVLRAINRARTRRGEEAGIDSYEATARFLDVDPEAAALIEQVREILASRGEELDLRRLDSDWVAQDRWLRSKLGDKVLNPASDQDLFRIRQEVSVRVIRPAELYAAVPAAVFDRLAARLSSL